MDGKSILSLLTGETDKTPHTELLFVGPTTFFGIRDCENFKYVDRSRCENAKYSTLKQGPFLFNLPKFVSAKMRYDN